MFLTTFFLILIQIKFVSALSNNLTTTLLRGISKNVTSTTGSDAATLVSFVTLGDWGGAGVEADHKTAELSVAAQLAISATALSAQFVINVGDNFYHYGVKSKNDTQWKTTFENVYKEKSMMIPWYSILGNHDYGYNPEAQVNYKSPNVNRWVMPGRYWHKRVQIGTSTQWISFVFVDSSPCQQVYRSSDNTGWDPCGASDTHKGYKDCKFHANILLQKCDKQLAWLKPVVKAIPADDWKIAVSHAPFDQLDVEDLTAVFQKAKFDMYLNGHVHNLAHYELDGDGATYVSISQKKCFTKIKSRYTFLITSLLFSSFFFFFLLLLIARSKVVPDAWWTSKKTPNT